MSALPQMPKRMTRQEYLERERRAEMRSEFHDGQVFAMAGASPDHVLITSNVNNSLSRQLRDRPCRVYSSDLRVSIESGRSYVYPDVVVVCGPLQFDVGNNKDTVTNPIVLVEVLSPSTERYDRGFKLRVYRKIQSLREYVLVSTELRQIEIFRLKEDGSWSYESCPSQPSPLELSSIGCKLDLDEVYFKTDVPIEPPDNAFHPDEK